MNLLAVLQPIRCWCLYLAGRRSVNARPRLDMIYCDGKAVVRESRKVYGYRRWKSKSKIPAYVAPNDKERSCLASKF